MPGLQQIIVFVIIAFVLVGISKRFAKKEATSFQEENPEVKEAQKLELVDAFSECIVTFEFKSKNDQFMIKSYPNIVINGQTYKLYQDTTTLRLPPTFSLHFGVPYMKGEAFKLDDHFKLIAGKKYKIIFKARAFVFKKAKVEVIEQGNI